MSGELVASALRRRYLLLAPLIALALVGSDGSEPTSSGTPSLSPPPSVSPVDPLAAVKAKLDLAYKAEAVYKVDNLVFAAGVGDELEALKLNEPKVAWGKEVIVQFPSQEAAGAEVVILRAPIPGDGSLCISEVGEVEDAGLYYARVAAGKKCPQRATGMPGWSKDQATGWGE